MAARWRKPDAAELASARTALPDAGWRLFSEMSAVDQKHALNVLADVRRAGYDDPALAQAALLHDAAKGAGNVTLFHRVGVVLVKGFAPGAWKRLKAETEPPRRSLLRPFWAHANHPESGAQLAAAAGCLPDAVDLIRRHQDPLPYSGELSRQDALLAALQKADDDN